MKHTMDRMIPGGQIDTVDARTRKARGDRGFGVLTKTDVTATMKPRLGVDMATHRILGACNPTMAYQAIGLKPRVGAMRPCNVILRAVEGGVKVSAIDPAASMKAIDNAALTAVAVEDRDLLAKAVAAI